MVLAALAYMAALGKGGLRQVAELCYHKAHYLAERIDGLAGYRVATPAPFFHEFAVACPRPVGEINRLLLEEYGIMGGYDLGKAYPELTDHMLLAVTERNSVEDMDDLVEALQEVGDA
jgi:glycine dehydrogenase subunit 1